MRADAIRSRALRASLEKSQCRERELDGITPADKPTLDADGIGRERQADPGDTGRHSIFGIVRHQAVVRVDHFQEIPERVLLQPVQQGYFFLFPHSVPRVDCGLCNAYCVLRIAYCVLRIA